MRTRVDVRYSQGNQSELVPSKENDSKSTEIKVEDINRGKGLPEVPIRTTRKPRRDVVCRSMGEEMTDSVISPDNKTSVLLSTIREANVLSPDSLNKQVWKPRKECDNITSTTQLLQHEAEILNYKKSPQQIPSKRARNITTLDLRRRNSDPATKIPTVVEQPSGPEHSPQTKLAPGADKLDWISRTSFTYAGHRFNKVSRFSKDDRCVYCNEGNNNNNVII